MRRLGLLLAVVLIGLWAWTQQPRRDVPGHASQTAAAAPADGPASATATRPTNTPASPASRYPGFLPREAHAVLDTLARGGPYAYRQDGNVFENRERRLPRQPRGYYREYTVPTPGSPDRGPRRIVAGGGVPGSRPPLDYWYSADHYRSFRQFELSGASP